MTEAENKRPRRKTAKAKPAVPMPKGNAVLESNGRAIPRSAWQSVR